jgi:hypothetical protein
MIGDQVTYSKVVTTFIWSLASRWAKWLDYIEHLAKQD